MIKVPKQRIYTVVNNAGDVKCYSSVKKVAGSVSGFKDSLFGLGLNNEKMLISEEMIKLQLDEKKECFLVERDSLLWSLRISTGFLE